MAHQRQGESLANAPSIIKGQPSNELAKLAGLGGEGSLIMSACAQSGRKIHRGTQNRLGWTALSGGQGEARDSPSWDSIIIIIQGAQRP